MKNKSIIEKLEQKEISFDYYKTNYAISSVFSSKIEGEEIELDSFFKHKFLEVKFDDFLKLHSPQSLQHFLTSYGI